MNLPALWSDLYECRLRELHRQCVAGKAVVKYHSHFCEHFGWLGHMRFTGDVDVEG